MSISILESHLRFNMEVNKLNAAYYSAFTPYEIDLLLNDAQLAYLAEKTGNLQGYGVDWDNVVMNQLSPVLVVQEPVTPINNMVSTANAPYKIISFIVDATKNNCSKTLSNCKIVKNQDSLGTTQISNFNWGRCIGYLSDKDIILKTDFTVNTCYVTYYRYPSQVSIGGYMDINGNSKTVVEWDFDDEVILEIIKKAAMLAIESINPTLESKTYVEGLMN